VILDEVAFWLSEESAQPDVEVLNAVRPCLATAGGPLVAISSPHARKGILWEAFSRDYGPDGDPDILVAQGSTLDFNLDRHANGKLKLQAWADRLYERDPIAAAAEAGGQFRSDLEQFVSVEVLNQVTDPVHERPFENSNGYVAFVDPSGGSIDSMTLAVGHSEDNLAVLDLVREVPAPFMPSEAVEFFVQVLRQFGVRSVHGDKYAAHWVVEAFNRHGVHYEHSELSKSELYSELLPALNSRTVALLTHDRLRRQFLALERSTARGRENIDHPRGGRDDLANAVAGCLVMVSRGPPPSVLAQRKSPINYPPNFY
jgi:hypothetical protein